MTRFRATFKGWETTVRNCLFYLLTCWVPSRPKLDFALSLIKWLLLHWRQKTEHQAAKRFIISVIRFYQSQPSWLNLYIGWFYITVISLNKGVHRNKSMGGPEFVFVPHPPRSSYRGGGKNLNCKFKTFGLLDTLKVHIQTNYLTRTNFSLLQTKLAEKTAN